MADSSITRCPECGASLSGGELICWLCKAEISAPTHRESVHGEQTAGDRSGSNQLKVHCGRQPENTWSFSLASLFMLVTICAVALGVFHAAPGLGILLAILSAPALIRSANLNSMWKRAGRPLTFTQKALSYLGSLGVMILCVASTCLAFFTICFPLGSIAFNTSTPRLGGPMFVGAWVLGISAGILVAGSMIYELWIKYVLRWRRNQLPPTWMDRANGLVQAVMLLLFPFAGALGVVFGCAYLLALSQNRPYGDLSNQSPLDVMAYVGFIVVFCGIFWLLRYLSRRFYRAMSILVATLFGCGVGFYLGALLGMGIGQVGAMVLACLGFLLGGVVGFQLAWHFPVQPLPSSVDAPRN